MDKISRERRSANMAKIRSVHTKPELAVRRLVYGLGLRYRLHQRDLPGTPDLVFRTRKTAIFVHGCFWHQHPKRECLDARRPTSNTSYWRPKLDRNIARDSEHLAALKSMGWKTLVVWECETRDMRALEARLRRFLTS